MALPDYTTQTAAQYKANIDSTASDHETKIGGLNQTVIDIGDWNMDTTTSVSVAHGLTHTKIRGIEVIIRNDDDTRIGPLRDDHGTSVYAAPPIYANSTNIVMTIFTGGIYDNTTYDSTSYNRGWIIIKHID